MADGVVLGGGISGLSLSHWLGLAENPGTWELWEATDHLGGTIGTDHSDGYSVDWGPNGFLDREPLTLRLVEEIGLRDSLEPANEKAEKRFIAKGGRLHPVPLSPPAMLTTRLLGLGGKMRVFMEPFVPARRDGGDESVFDFASRRIGRCAAETFVDPMVSGVFGGVARELSLPACFPIMREMEVKYGGLVKALIARQRERKRESGQTRQGGPAGPGGRLTSFRGGLSLLVERLAERVKTIIRVKHRVVQITRRDDTWEVMNDLGSQMLFKNVVLACPTYAASTLLQPIDPDLASALRSIPYAPIAVVATGHRRKDIAHPLDGFGFLIPRNEGVRTLGSIWTSSIFAERAPQDCVQFRTMLGGAGDPDILKMTDSQLWSQVKEDLDQFVGIRADPTFLRIYRWEKGIPQYTLGHIERRTTIERLLARHPGLHAIGNAFYGVSLNDCVKMAYHLAQRIRGSGNR